MWLQGDKIMKQAFFIVGTDTDVGKTFVTAQLVKGLKKKGIRVGYYKAALSGAYYDGDHLIPGDAKEVLEAGGIEEEYEHCVSYILERPVSPHLAARLEGVHISMEKIKSDYARLKEKYELLYIEGSGGVVCPIKLEDEECILLEDIIIQLQTPVILVARSGVGTINHTVLTCSYLKSKSIPIKGIILNEFDADNYVHRDNKSVIEKLTGVEVIATVPANGYEDGVVLDGLC